MLLTNGVGASSRRARSSGSAHASAVRRLGNARDLQTRLGEHCAAVAGTRAEPLAQERLSAGRADVASREAWLHWVEEGESIEPWADGEWAPTNPVAPRGPDSRRFGREIRGIQQGLGRGEQDLARAIDDTAKRIRISARRSAAAARRDLRRRATR
jgi:hypothetical protein